MKDPLADLVAAGEAAGLYEQEMDPADVQRLNDGDQEGPRAPRVAPCVVCGEDEDLCDHPTGADVLAVAMAPDDNDIGAGSIREYLVALARQVWVDGEGFSGKRPWGNSGWTTPVEYALIQARYVRGVIDPDYGYVDEVDTDTVDLLIGAALDALAAGG